MPFAASGHALRQTEDIALTQKGRAEAPHADLRKQQCLPDAARIRPIAWIYKPITF
jgi:hypothetical protein